MFDDVNKNKLKDTTPPPAELNYTGGTSTIKVYTGDDPTCSFGVPLTLPTATGAFTTGAVLLANTYTLCYASLLPAGYNMTFPINGPPPYFNVVVGPSCNSGTSNSATCSSGTISNANFGITNSIPWIRSIGTNMRIDAGFDSRIPAAATFGTYASLVGGGGTPGIIFSGSFNPFFGTAGGSASINNWKVGTSSFPELFTPFSLNIIKTSYSYLLATAEKNELIPADIASPCGVGGIANCALSLPADPGLYIANGNLTINNGSDYTIPANQDYVILVNGDLRIRNRILAPLGSNSTVTFSVKGDIRVDGSVGESAPSSTNTTIAGFYSGDKNFIVRDDDSDDIDDEHCATADRRLNIAGSVIVNASLTGGSFQNQRDLCIGNINHPTVFFQERIDFLLNAPQFIQFSQNIWQEVAP